MSDREFSNFKPHPLCQNRNIAVHISTQFKSFCHLFAVDLQSAVEIVNGDSCKEACYQIEQF